MNKDKIIKDLKERNDKLADQRRQFEARLYHEQYLSKRKDEEIEKLNKEKDDIFNKAVEINNKLRDSKNKEIDKLNEELGDANYTITQLHKVMDKHYVEKEDYDRLNNIIDEFEKWLETEIKFQKIIDKDYELRKALLKLKELKEGKENEKDIQKD